MNEIDYEKLAEAIVNAQKMAQTKERKRNTVFRSFVLKLLNFAIYAFLVAVSIAGIYLIWNVAINQSIFAESTAKLLTVLLVIIAMFSFLSMVEAFFDKSDDSKAYFSINMSLIALMISIISLITRFIDL